MIAGNPRHVRGAGLDGRSPAELAEAAAEAGRIRLERRWKTALPVVSPGFTVDDLTPRAFCRALVRRPRSLTQ